jgi:hypothetical protein
MAHAISLDDAAAMTALYRANRETILATGYRGNNVLAICETYSRDAFDAVLSQTGCAKVRIYYGMDENYRVHAIVVGVNGDDEDMLPSQSTQPVDELIEAGNRCPDLCPPASALNED